MLNNIGGGDLLFDIDNKIISDETKTLFGMDASALPDDVFQYIAENVSPKVGDLKKSIRTDLGDDWLLCNGGAL